MTTLLLAFAMCGLAADPLAGDALYQDVITYTALAGTRPPITLAIAPNGYLEDTHQTGGTADLATANWLAGELERAGLAAEKQPWTFRRWDVERAEFLLTVDGRNIDTFPFWFPKNTGVTPVRAPLAVFDALDKTAGLAGKIAFVPSSAAGRALHSTGINAWAEAASKAGALGLIAVGLSESGDLAAINGVAPYTQTPLPVPSLIIATRDESNLRAAADAAKSASILINGDDIEDATAFNVIGKLSRGPKWIVVTTPFSGWFTCAGERGPGVALWLALARWAAESKSPHSFLFIANSGHELDFLGARHALDHYALPVADVACWIHLGASIATRAWEIRDGVSIALDAPQTTGNLVTVPALETRVRAAFADVPFLAPRSSGPVAGELQHFIEAGYPAMGFFGGHHYFHTRRDLPKTTAPEFLGPVARSLVKLIESTN